MEFKDVFFCLLPGIVGGVPYWVIWPVRRRIGDVLAMIAMLFVLAVVVSGCLAKLCVLLTGGSMMFGEWGEIPLVASVCVVGMVLGALMGIDRNRKGPNFYPYSPFLFR